MNSFYSSIPFPFKIDMRDMWFKANCKNGLEIKNNKLIIAGADHRTNLQQTG